MRLQDHVERLEETVAEKDAELDDYESKLAAARSDQRKEARRDREVTRLERENRRLQSEIDERDERIEELEGKLERLKDLWKLDHSNFADVSEKKEGLVPVKVVEQFTRDAIEDADERFGLAENDVVMFRDASGAGASTADMVVDIDPRVVLRNGGLSDIADEILFKHDVPVAPGDLVTVQEVDELAFAGDGEFVDPRIVLRNGGLSDIADEILFKHDVPVAPADLVTVQEVDELAVARDREVEAAIEDWERRAEKRERERNAEMVDRLISEHRADRGESD